MNRQEIEKIFKIKESWELPQKAMEMLKKMIYLEITTKMRKEITKN